MAETIGYRLPEHLAARQSAQRREWGVQLVAGALAVVCFVAAGALLPPLNAIRRDKQLVIDPDTVAGLPPDLALLGKLGTFRALAIDWAAIRAERLKQEGKNHEALALHETVCALAPRFPRVWANAAWNMAYNISVYQYSPEARWQWVQNGIRILRDKGIQYNPKAAALYKELAWIYWHKIGDFLDDHHLNYKRALAVDMERVLGPPPVTLSDAEYRAWFQRVVEAPRDLDAFIANDPEVERLVFQLGEVALKPDESLLEFVARHKRPELQVAQLAAEGVDVARDAETEKGLEVIRDPDHREALTRLLAAVRSKVLREKYKFDLDFMDELMDRYGPLDWRNAFAHALYWSSYGDRVSRAHERSSIHDKINTARFVFIALQHMVMKGRITLRPDFDDPFQSYIELTPDTRYIPYLYETYMRLGKEHFGDHPGFREGTPGPRYMNGFVSSMHEWIELLYLEGGQRNIEMAENFYAWLRENNPHPDGSTQERYLQTLDQFVMADILSQLATYRAASGLIRSFIQRALKQFALGLTEPAVTSLRRARQSYEYWMIDTKNDPTERRKMQPFRVIVRDEVESFMTQPRVSPLFKAELWKHLLEVEPQLNQMVYDRLLPYFQRLCQALEPPWAIEKAFPEPPGMERFRQTELEYRGEARREGVQEGTHEKHQQ